MGKLTSNQSFLHSEDSSISNFLKVMFSTFDVTLAAIVKAQLTRFLYDETFAGGYVMVPSSAFRKPPQAERINSNVKIVL